MKYEMIGILPEYFWYDVDFLLQKFLHVFFSEMSKETEESGFWENCWEFWEFLIFISIMVCVSTL